MPTTYIRTSDRGNWTEQQLNDAVNAVINNSIGINEASRTFNIPSRTLRRRIQNRVTKKIGMGRAPTLGYENERKLVIHLKKLQSRGFAATRYDVRVLACNFANSLNIQHKFSNGKAGYDWLNSFLRRNPDLCIRKSEGISTARVRGLNKEVVRKYFQLLQNVMEEHNLFNKPGHLYNMDETSLQLNNKPAFVLAEKGSKSVASVTSGEKGETITVIACCNAEGTFLPPACIMKGKNKKAEYEDGMPPGAVLYMSEKSAYINASLFLQWLKDLFIPRKPQGKVLLIVDGHTSHCNIETLEYAEANNVIIMSLPSHTTHYLQPLDRAVFKSLKSAYYCACQMWMKKNPSRQIKRLQFGKLLYDSWTKAANPNNAISAFKSTGIYPYDENVVPDYAFLMSNEIDDILNPNSVDINVETPLIHRTPTKISVSTIENPLPGPSRQNDEPHKEFQDQISLDNTITPGKVLENIDPVPSIKLQEVKKRSRQIAAVMTSPEFLNDKKSKLKKKNEKKGKTQTNMKKKEQKNKKMRKEYSDTGSDESVPYEEQDIQISEEDDSKCVGCGENYKNTKKRDDWVQCVYCKKWSHENCSKYENLCDLCGKVLTTKKI